MSDPDPPDARPAPDLPSSSRSSGRELVALVVVGVALIAGMGWWAWPDRTQRSRQRLVTVAGTPLAEGSAYVGSSACRECHPGEHAGHLASGHAHTLRRPERIELARWLHGRRASDPEAPGVTWSYRLGADGLVAERSERGEIQSRTRLDIALGSGTHAVTLLSIIPTDDGGPPGGLEHRLTYFAHQDALALTPGQQVTGFEEPERTPDGYRLTPAILLDCLECHGTRTAAPRDGGIALETLLPNIDCERCHGPGRFHVELARSGIKDQRALALPFGPERWTSADQIQLCGRCHRLPSMVPPESIRPDNPELARFPSVGLLQSACYLESRGDLSCTTCHDPHARSASAANPYENACLGCHGGRDSVLSAAHANLPARTVCPIEPRSGCVSCHMPRRDVGHGLEFSDHWIRAVTTARGE